MNIYFSFSRNKHSFTFKSYSWFKYYLDQSTTYVPKGFNPAIIRTHDFLIMTVHFHVTESSRCHHSAIIDVHVKCVYIKQVSMDEACRLVAKFLKLCD